MLSLVVMFIVATLIVYLADAITTHEGLAIALRLLAVLGLVVWALNVFDAIQLPIDPW